MRVRTALGRIALASALTVTPAVVAVSPAHAGTTPLPGITDDQGRTLILHGLNTSSSAKGPNGLPWVTQDDIAREARDLGTNSVRYLIQWKNVEPEPGHRFHDKRIGDGRPGRQNGFISLQARGKRHGGSYSL